MRNTALVLVLSAGALAGASAAENWPAFRGAGGAGISQDAKVAREWGDRRNVKWKAALPGPGASSPVVWGDRVFVTAYSGYADGSAGGQDALKRHLLCLDRKDGKVLWTKTVAAVLPEDVYRGYITEHGYASSTPATDGERVYAFFGKCGVYAYDFQGQELWHVDVGRSSGNRGWGSASSPLLYKELVIVNAAEESRALYALDRKTGKQVWKVPSNKTELTYGTPGLVDLPDGRKELVIAVPGEVWGFDPDSGKNTWYAGISMGGNICPTVTTGPGVVYVTGGFPQGGFAAIRAGGQGDVTASHVLWTTPYTSYVPSPVLSGGCLYWVNEQGVAHCLDAKTGELKFQERLATAGDAGRPRVYASTLLIGDRLYTVSRNLGTFLWSAAARFQQLAQNRFASDESVFNATPAVSDGQLFLRSNQFLYCIQAGT